MSKPDDQQMVDVVDHSDTDSHDSGADVVSVDAGGPMPLKSNGEVDIAKATIPAVLEFLHTTEQGLTDMEVAVRTKQYGPNAIKNKETPEIVKFLLFFWNPLSWAMEFAALLAIVLNDYADFVLISALLTFNACIGYFEERSSGQAVKALQAQLSAKTYVLRNGEWAELSASELVPGDVIKLRLGGVVPADCKLLYGDPLTIDQSGLTGESLAVTKHSGAEAYSGSMVKTGDINAVVYATGKNTFFGQAASLVASTENSGHFQQVLKRIGYFCIAIIFGFVVAELAVQFGARNKPCTGVLDGECVSLSNILVIVVGGIPIAMPTVLSVTMAIGAGYLAKEQALVTRLTSIEELAGMDVLCSDKTGTLTLNELQVNDAIGFGVCNLQHNTTRCNTSVSKR
jgi:H+-transporting ATPase